MAPSEMIVLLLFMFLIASIYILEAALIVAFVFGKLGKKPRKRILTGKSAILIHSLAVIGILCFLYGYFIEPYWIEVNTISIKTPKLKAASFRIVQISDLHCTMEPRNEKKMVEMINRLDADIVVFTGDAVNRSSALPLFKDTMRSIEASVAKLAVRGNFETGRRGNLDLYSDTGFELLEANSVKFTKNGDTLFVTGLACNRPGEFKQLLEQVPAEPFKIFLHHYSDLVEDLEGLNVDLYLAGHTHGGQVAIPIYGALITLSKFGKKYEAGLYTVGDTKLYVNRGIGLETMPAPKVRFFARPEITVFDIEPMK